MSTTVLPPTGFTPVSVSGARSSVIKRPASERNWGLDLTDWLGPDTIATVAWTVPSDLVKISASNTTTLASVMVGGGTAGQDYEISALVTTAAGETEQFAFDVYCRNA